jgi:hypothetical protein
VTTNINILGKVYCSTLETLGSPFLEQAMAPSSMLNLSLDGGDYVLCDWYVYPDTANWREAS